MMMENNSLAALEMKKEVVQQQIRNKWWWNFWTTLIFWIGIFVFLAFLGFNVFTALGETSDFAADIINKIKKFLTAILQFFGIDPKTSDTDNSSVKNSDNSSSLKSKQTNGLINQVSNTKVSGIDSIQKSISNLNSENDEYDNDQNHQNDQKIQNYNQTNSFNKRNIPSLGPNTSQRRNLKEESIIKKRFPISDTLPEPSEGNTFNTIATGHGYCFIGEDQGVRSCFKTDDVGSCPTGLGYQSEATCQNPNLRD